VGVGVGVGVEVGVGVVGAGAGFAAAVELFEDDPDPQPQRKRSKAKPRNTEKPLSKAVFFFIHFTTVEITRMAPGSWMDSCRGELPGEVAGRAIYRRALGCSRAVLS
jgi:hypothetical protein